MKFIKHIVGFVSSIAVAMSLAVATAQTPVATTTSAPVPPLPDLSMLTNHAALVDYAFKQVADVSLQISSGAQANNWQPGGFFTITDKVKNERTMNAALNPYWWGIQLIDTNANVNIYAGFQNSPTNGNTPTYALFNSWGGGQPVNMGSYWGLPDVATSMQIQLAQQIWIPVPGLVDARMIITDQWGDYGMQLSVQNEGFWFMPDYAYPNVVVVLTRQFQDSNGWWYSYTQGVSLATATEIPLTWVQFRVLLTDSQDFISLPNNPASMDISIYSYQGYGKVPLLMPTFVKDITKGVVLSVHTTEGQYATGFVIENLLTGDKLTIPVPAGQTSITRNFPAGDYSIIPLGINLKAPSQYYGKGI